MDFIYSYSYLGAILSAIAWYFLESRQKSTQYAKIGFWVCVVGYLFGFLFNDGSLLYKVLILARDGGVFIVSLFAFHILLKKSKVLLAMGTALLIGGQAFYLGALEKTFVFHENLDPKGELLFDIKSHSDLKKIKKSLEGYELKITKAFPNLKHKDYSNLDEYYVVDIPGDYVDELDEIVESLKDTKLVDWVEENEIIKVEPNAKNENEDSENKSPIDYGINDPDLNQLWGFEQMKMDQFYKPLLENKFSPKKQALIAILDTGVDGKHEDLKDSFISLDSNYDRDVVGHGTHCAGIAASVSNNGIGIGSFAPNDQFVRVTSIKVLSDDGSGSQKSIIDGIIRAADEGADVLSLSLGGPSNDESQKAYSEAVKYANKAGGIVVVAAGNESSDAQYVAPANSSGVIVVAAVDSKLDPASFSNSIENLKMGISAPGVDIYSTIPSNKYSMMSGTSMAAPYVAGLLGVMKAINPSLDTQQAYEILKETGIDTGNTESTGKFIQPSKVLEKF